MKRAAAWILSGPCGRLCLRELNDREIRYGRFVQMEIFPMMPSGDDIIGRWVSWLYSCRCQLVIEEGSVGMAPCCVQTNADVTTAFLWASSTDFPLRMLAMNAAVKESPAPTVSATSTLGVGWKETWPGVKT